MKFNNDIIDLGQPRVPLYLPSLYNFFCMARIQQAQKMYQVNTFNFFSLSLLRIAI
jgi:hypothetical protein